MVFGFKSDPKRADPSAVPQPSAGKVFATWLFGGATPGDMARANAAELERAAQTAELRRALIGRLTGVGQGAGVQLPADIPMIERSAPAAPQASPLSRATGDIAASLAEETFGPSRGLAALERKGPAVEAVALEGVPMRGAARPSAPARVRSLREAQDVLLPALMMGVPGAKEAADFLDKSGPKLTNVNGLMVDERDGANVNRFIPSLDKGQEPLFDASGRIVAVRNMDGSVRAAAEMAGAVSGAQEGAKAAFDVIEVPMLDGTTRTMTRSAAIQAMGGGSGVPAASPGGGAGFGVRPSKAQEEYSTGKAKTQVEVEALTPKARSTLDTLDRKTAFVLEKLAEAKRQATGGLGGGAGLNSLLSGIPETAAFDLKSTLDTIEANVGFDELQQMRENSPTGGAVGSLTERELGLLSSLKGSLKAGQSPEQLRDNIDRLMTELRKVSSERKQAFQRQYGRAAGARPQITPEQARAELARRRAARGGQ